MGNRTREDAFDSLGALAIFDLTGSYKAAFVNGILFNLVNVSLALFLLRRAIVRPAFA